MSTTVLPEHARLPCGEGHTERAFNRAQFFGNLSLWNPGLEGVAQARVCRDPSLALKQRTRKGRQDLRRGPSERKRPAQRADRLTWAIAPKERLAQAAKEICRPDSLLHVLDSDAEDFLGLLGVPQVHARGAQQTETFRNEGPGIGRYQLTLRGAQKDGERCRPAAQQLHDFRPLLAKRGGLGLSDFRQIDRASRSRR